MGLTAADYKQIRTALDKCHKPLFLFDDDPDGLCSFVLLYRYADKGKGIPVKPVPRITLDYERRVQEYGPDAIFILDIANVDQEFLDAMTVPVYWLDHHEPAERENVKYFNSRTQGKMEPTTVMAYKTVKQNMWIGMVGGVADWHLPSFRNTFAKKYPKLWKPVKTPPEALYGTPVGKLVRIISFNLKGKNEDIMKAVRILTRIETPEELLDGTTARAKFLLKRYEKVNKHYVRHVKNAEKHRDKNFLLYEYSDSFSLSSDLSNELLYRNKGCVVIIARPKDDEMRMSFRGDGKNVVRDAVKELAAKHGGYGGGHEYACGGSIPRANFEQFIADFRKAMKV